MEFEEYSKNYWNISKIILLIYLFFIIIRSCSCYSFFKCMWFCYRLAYLSNIVINFLMVPNSYHCVLLTLHYYLEYFTLSNCELSISFKQWLNEAKLSNNVCFFLFTCLAAVSAPAPTLRIVPLTNIYAFLQSHKTDFNIVFLNSVWLYVLYVPRVSSFILTNFFQIQMVE